MQIRLEKQELTQVSTESLCPNRHHHICANIGIIYHLTTYDPPITDIASEHLGEAVAPEEAAQHHAGLPLAPAELLCHADGTDGHRHTGTVEEACPEQQHNRPYPRHRPAQCEVKEKDNLWT